MAADITAQRRAASAAQAILSEAEPKLVVDGKAGTFTGSVYDKASSSTRAAVDAVVKSLGFAGFAELRTLYVKQKTELAQLGAIGNTGVFDLQIVPAVIREARRIGLNPSFVLAQLCLESGFGRSTPRGDDGSPSLNYAGLKWNSISPRTARKATAATNEVIGGRQIRENAVFAAFDSPSHFANAYITYLTSGPSAYRYKGLVNARSVEEYGSILQKGGYATDPLYAAKLAKTALTVSSRYGVA